MLVSLGFFFDAAGVIRCLPSSCSSIWIGLSPLYMDARDVVKQPEVCQPWLRYASFLTVPVDDGDNNKPNTADESRLRY